MTIKQEVEIWQDVEVDLGIDEIYNNLSNSEKDELLAILLENRGRYNNLYYIESLILGKSDSNILTNKKVWDKIIRLIKYEESTLKDYIIEELLYEPNKTTK
jgi:hypothetical protein